MPVRRWAIFRLIWFVGGGLLVFGGPDAVGAPKLVYLGGVTLSAISSSARVQRSKAEWMTPFRPILPATTLLAAMLAVSLLAGTNGTTLWLRDAAPYLLIVVAPVIALDAAHDISEARLFQVIVLFGLISAVSFTTDWLSRRGISSLPVGRIIFGSGALASLGFAFAVTKVATGPRRPPWVLAAVTIPAVMLSTGSRSLLGMGAAFLGIIGSKARHRVGILRATVIIGGCVGALAYAVPRLFAMVSNDPGFLPQRIEAAKQVINGSGGDDGSYAARSESYSWALQTWHEHRWLGTGPGFLYPRGTFTLDTPILTLAKFGIIGAAVLLLFLIVLVRSTHVAGRQFGWRPCHTGIRAYACIIVILIPLAPAVEDKGFSFTIALALCAAAAAARESSTRDASDRPRTGSIVLEDVAREVGPHGRGLQATRVRQVHRQGAIDDAQGRGGYRSGAGHLQRVSGQRAAIPGDSPQL